jgi:formylglycine-generating enzyme required for sulfatase activity
MMRRPAILAALATILLPVAGAGGHQAGGPAPPDYRESIPGTLVAFDMVAVPGGTVVVDGQPVTVRPFHIGRTEVTWDMYDVFALGLDTPAALAGADAEARPSEPYGAPDQGWGHAGYPAMNVTRAAAEAFAAWLSRRTGRTYRLPTEAEWRLAAERAAAPPARLDDVAWHAGNAGGRAHPVGQKAADALGLHDLFGNVAEWVMPSDGALVVLGGSFRDPAATVGPMARTTQQDAWNERDPQLPRSRWWLTDAPFVGFRIVSPNGEGAGK